MKYKKGDDIYLKGQIAGVSSCGEVPFPYEVLISDGFISAREEDIASVNEPEKPVVPQFVADWYEKNKDDFEFNIFYYLCVAYYDNPSKLSKDVYQWFADSRNEPIQTLVNMHQFGYEVEKEKLYTVFQVATEEYLYTNGVGKLSSVHVSYAFVEEHEEYHFTQQKLEELNYWENPAFEIKEVKK